MIRFDRARARGLTATIELRVRLRNGGTGLPFALRIEQGRLRIRPGAPRDARASATLHLRDLVALMRGTTGWPALLAESGLGEPAEVARG